MSVRRIKTKAEVFEEGQRSLDAWDDPEKKKELAETFNKTACDEATAFLAVSETEKIDSDSEKRREKEILKMASLTRCFV